MSDPGKRTPTPGVVYFVAEWDEPYVKIGAARKDREGGFPARIKELQTGNPKCLYPMHTVFSADVFRDETVLHGYFADFHVEGGGKDWYQVPDGVDFTDWLRESYWGHEA
jgi:hypothetical protein